MERILSLCERLITAVCVTTAVICLPLMIGARVWEIYSRNVLNQPVLLVDWIEAEALYLIIFLSLAYAYCRNAHVRVDIVRERFSPRTKALVELTGIVLFAIPFTAIVVFYGYDRVAGVAELNTRSALAFGRPLGWVIQSAMPVGVGLFGLAALVAMIRNLRFLLFAEGDPTPS